MKAIKILTFVIIGILIIGVGIGAYVYFYTDTFKTNKEIFYKYANKEQLTKIIDFDSIKQTLTRLESEKSEQNIEATINMTMDDQDVLNNATVSLTGKSDPTKNKSEISLAFGNDNKKDVLQIDGIYNKEKVGILFKDITNKYIALENKNLNQFWEKLGLNSLDMDEIDFSNYNSKADENIEKVKAICTEFFTKMAEQTTKEQYSNLGKTQIKLNGASVEAKAYELKVNSEEIKNIYASINTGNSDTNEIIGRLKESIGNSKFDFLQTIYVYEEKLAMIEMKIEGEDYQMKATKQVGTQNDNLTIQIVTPDKQQVIIDILTASTSENGECSINFGMTGNEDSEYKFSANVNMNVKFNVDDTIKELTDKNSVIVNNMSIEEIRKIGEAVVTLVKEKEGIENTVLETFTAIAETNLNNKVESVTENTIEEQQLSQGMEQLEEMARTTNN